MPSPTVLVRCSQVGIVPRSRASGRRAQRARSQGEPGTSVRVSLSGRAAAWRCSGRTMGGGRSRRRLLMVLLLVVGGRRRDGTWALSTAHDGAQPPSLGDLG